MSVKEIGGEDRLNVPAARYDDGRHNVFQILVSELSTARTVAQRSKAALARDIGCSRRTVSDAERGPPGIPGSFWQAADKALQTSGALTVLHDLGRYID